MGGRLHIISTPYKPSRLSIPPSPFSPRLPLTPSFRPFKPATASSANQSEKQYPTTPPPPEPLSWLWECHKCFNVYPLSVTSRCLDDGHSFCTSTSKRCDSIRRRACDSEFDYSGWETWGVWRRGLGKRANTDRRGRQHDQSSLAGTITEENGESLPITAFTKDCWNNCDFPSACRWSSTKEPVTNRSSQSSVVSCDELSLKDATLDSGSNAKHSSQGKLGECDMRDLTMAKVMRRRSFECMSSPLSSHPVANVEQGPILHELFHDPVETTDNNNLSIRRFRFTRGKRVLKDLYTMIREITPYMRTSRSEVNKG